MLNQSHNENMALFTTILITYSVIIFIIKIFYVQFIIKANRILLKEVNPLTIYCSFIPFLGELIMGSVSSVIAKKLDQTAEYNKISYKKGELIAICMFVSFILSIIGLPVFLLSGFICLFWFWFRANKNLKKIEWLLNQNNLNRPY